MLKTAFCTLSSRESSIELIMRDRNDWSRDSDGWISLMDVMIIFICRTMSSTMFAVSACSFCGASFRIMASVVERHWFMLSTVPVQQLENLYSVMNIGFYQNHLGISLRFLALLLAGSIIRQSRLGICVLLTGGRRETERGVS